MKKTELESRLADAFERATPDDLQIVLSRCQPHKEAEQKVIDFKRHKKRLLTRYIAAACLALVLLVGGAGVTYQQIYAVSSIISLDVNPSIELRVNSRERVLSCTPINLDAVEILEEMGNGDDLEGAKLVVAVNAIVGALVRHGYLEQASSAILISVEDANQNRASRIQQELTGAVDSVLHENSAGASILSQTFSKDDKLNALAQQNNMSAGKAALITQILSRNNALSFDTLSTLSIEELKDLAEMPSPAMPVGKNQALAAAMAYAGVAQESLTGFDVDPELDEVPAYYEVELYHKTFGELEYLIDAWSGAVISGRKNVASTPDTGTDASGQGMPEVQEPARETEDIGQTAAKAAALRHSGVSESAVTSWTIERDYDDGRLKYEIEFNVGLTEYDYTIDGVTGTVIDYDIEHHDPAPVRPPIPGGVAVPGDPDDIDGSDEPDDDPDDVDDPDEPDDDPDDADDPDEPDDDPDDPDDPDEPDDDTNSDDD